MPSEPVHPSCVLENSRLRVEVRPTIGGKISSLLDVRTNREWLWRNPLLPIRTPRYADSYVMRNDSGGFDECFPAVAEGAFPTSPWEGVPVPDHGELWGLPWDYEATAMRVRMGVDGVRFPYRFERSLELSPHAPEVKLSYRAINRAPFPFPFLWSAHPLLAVEPGMRLLLPDEAPLRIYGGSETRFGGLGSPIQWPRLLERDLSLIPRQSAGFAVKLFGASPERGWVGLHDPKSASTLRMEYDPAHVPHLGLWLNMGGWTPFEGETPYFNVGLEPCIGAGDDLSLAVRHFRAHGVIPAKGETRWSLTLRFVDEPLT